MNKTKLIQSIEEPIRPNGFRRKVLWSGWLIFFALVCSTSSFAQCLSCTTTISGSDGGTYNVYAGEKLCLSTNAQFVGTINFYGGTIENCATTVQDFIINFTSPATAREIINNGLLETQPYLTAGTNTTINNFGTWNAGSSLILSDNAIFNNYGRIEGDLLTASENSTLNNFNEIEITSALVVATGSTMNNELGGHIAAWTMTVRGNATNEGDVDLNANFLVEGGAEWINDGGCLDGASMTIRGSLIGLGCGTITIQNTTELSSGSSLLSGNIAIVDLTPPSNAPYVDVNFGTIEPTVTWVSCGCNSDPPKGGNLTIDNVSAVEGNNLTFTISVTLAVPTDTTFDINYNNISAESTDYSGPSTITLLANQTSVSFDVTTVDDNLFEGTENFEVVISDPSDLFVILDGLGSGIILDNDQATVSTSSYDVDEDAGIVMLRVFLSGSGASVGVEPAFTVDLDVNSNSVSFPAADGTDYTGFTTTISFPANSPVGTEFFIPLTILDDTIVEPSEQVIQQLSNIQGATGISFSPEGIVRIHDDDSVTVFFQDITVNENAGNVVYEFTLSGETQEPFNVSYVSIEGTATDSEDYVGISGTLSFTGNNNEVVTVNLPIIDDSIIEFSETFQVEGTHSTPPPTFTNAFAQNILFSINPATITITDNDSGGTSGITFNNDNVTINEAAGTATVVVRLEGAISGGFTVDYTTSNGTAIEPGDYTTTSGTLSFTGNNGETQSITIPIIDDNIVEATENLVVNLSNLSTSLITIIDDQATVNITDDDVGPGTGVSFDNDDITVDEAAGTATINVLLTGNIPGGFTIDYTTNDGTAGEPGDYTTTSGQLTFVGTDGELEAITVPIIDDLLIEVTENFVVDLSNLSTTLIGITDAQGTVNITDNDGGGTTGISFDNDDITVDEAAGTATINVLLTGNIPGGFTIDFTTNDGTAGEPGDYTAISGQLTFVGTDGELQAITVPIIDDLLIEATENFVVDLSNLSTTLIGITDSQGTVNITDNDSAATDGLSIRQADIVVTEGVGVTATFDVTLTGDYAVGFDVDYSTAFGTATATDITPITNGTISFTGNNNEVQQITVTILNDNIIEVQEEYTVTLNSTTNPLLTINDATANGIINDDDGAGIGDGIAVADFSVNEDTGTVDFVITYTGPTVQDAFTVDFNVSDGSANASADYTVAVTTGVVNFPANTSTGTQQIVTVTIIDDIIFESTEDLNITLSNSNNPLIAIVDADGLGTITDNEVDLDSDNDGILDSVEDANLDGDNDASTDPTDTDGDGIPDILDLDSDDDGCSDTIEAGFTDSDDDGILGTSPITIDANGQVVGQGGYTAPSDANGNSVFDFQEAGPTISIPVQNAYVATGADAVFFVTAIGTSLNYQWQVSTDSGVNYSDIIGETGASLTISGASATEDGNFYRVHISDSAFVCNTLNSRAGIIIISPDTDNDGIADITDLDDDNDGILDTDEGCGSTTSVGSTIGFGNPVVNSTYSLPEVDLTYTVDNVPGADILGFNTGANGPSIRFMGLGVAGTSTLTSTFSSPVANVEFKLTDLDFHEDVTVNIYDENDVLYDLSLYGVVAVGSNIEQTGNNFITVVSTLDTDGNNPIFDPLAAVVFFFPQQVSRIEIAFNNVGGTTASIRYIEPTYCSLVDTDGDTINDQFDTDSDNDGCNDAIEAGFTDVDDDGLLGTSPITVDTNGLVVGQGGYTTPSDADTNAIFDFQETGVLPTISENPENAYIADGADAVFSVTATGTNLSYQWQVSTDSGATYSDISGETGTSLTITASSSEDGNYYRVIISDNTFVCTSVNSEAGILIISPDTDNDGIIDLTDLDDDNDGILDEDEIVCAAPTQAIAFTNSGSTSSTFSNREIPVDDATTLIDVDLSSGSFVVNSLGTIRMQGDAFVTNTLTLTFQEEVSLVIGSHTSSLGGNFDLNERWSILALGETFTVDDPNGDITDTSTGAIIVDGVQNDMVEFYRNAGGLGDNLDWTMTSSPAKVFYIRYTSQLGNNIGQIKASINCLYVDTDNDGLPDNVDLDSDNDGIYDVIEAGHDQAHTLGRLDGAVGTDGIPDVVQATGEEDNGTINYTIQDSDGAGANDFQEADSDADGCSDADEAYGDLNADSDDNGEYGSGTPSVNTDGAVTAASYSVPIDGDTNTVFDFQEAGVLPTISAHPENAYIADGADATFSVTATGTSLNYQWQVSTDSGASYSDINGETGTSLTIIAASASEDLNQYRVVISDNTFVCSVIISNAGILFISTDTDNDGIIDLVDLDDDNDGILDSEEGCDTTIILTPTYVSSTSASNATLVASATANGIINRIDGAGTDGHVYNSTSSGVTNPTFSYTLSVPANTFISTFELYGAVGVTPTEQLRSYNVQITNTVTSAVIFTGDTSTAVNLTNGVPLDLGLIFSEGSYSILLTDTDVPITNREFSEIRFVGNQCNVDTDGDSILDYLDLDSDNDGIYDVVEAGHDQEHTLGTVDGVVGTDGIPDLVQATGQEDNGTINYTIQDSDGAGANDFQEADSDADGCNDTIEAGFTDPDDDGYLSNSPLSVDANGVIIGKGGYTAPADVDGNLVFDFQEAGVLPTISLHPEDVYVADGADATFSVIATGGNLSYQWQVSTNSGTSYSDISGETGSSLTISAASTGEDGNYYRVTISDSSFACVVLNSDAGVLIISPDTDNDGIIDVVDLDDDNDGILDCVESGDTLDSRFGWFLNNPAGTLAADTFINPEINNWFLSATEDYSFSGITISPVVNAFQITNMPATNFAEAYDNDNFIQVAFTTAADLISPQLNNISFSLTNPSSGDSYSASVLISDDNFVSYSIAAKDVFITDDGSAQAHFDMLDATEYALKSNTTYTFRVYVYGQIDDNAATFSKFDDFRFNVLACQGLDSDNDSILDHLDLDADNDGIPDNIEAQTTIGYLAPDGLFDANGVDTAYPTGITPTNTDGADEPDYLDSDSDNEGGDDTTEAGITLTGTDTDNDGLDDATDATPDYTDVGGTIDNPLSGPVILPDVDGDATTGGDVDFRDATDDRTDTDDDGIPDEVDLDDDNDGILDTDEDANIDGDNDPSTDPTDTDNDGVWDYIDLDADNDGIPDNVEAQTTIGYIAPDGIVDANGVDTAYPTGIIPTNTDGADEPDYLDLDSDNEGGDDTTEAGITLTGNDDDNDGLDNATDATPDYTDVGGTIDNPLNPPVILPDTDSDATTGGDVDFRDATDDRPDTDNDGIPDEVDLDDDNDGILDTDEDANVDGDNDPSTDPTDTDNDGVWDYIDLDSDNDGIPDNVEAQTTVGYIAPDGIVDANGVDTAYPTGIIPTNTDGIDTPDYIDTDSDNEGGDDTAEAGITLTGTDTDNDGLDDATDATPDYTDVGGTIDNPLNNPVILPDVDADATSGGDVDFRDATDNRPDTDDDGIPDATDLDDDNDGIPDTEEDMNTDGDNDPSTDPTDTDNDGVWDYIDLDSDNDGIPDNVEAQTTIGYIAPNGVVDTNGLDTAYPTGLIPTNTDGVDTPDYLDLDSDNEGGDDTAEAGITLTGNDTDNDGLDDGTDATPDYTDVGGTIDNPLFAPVILPDVDSDATTGGDVDFRDPSNDSSVDIDSDDDGILDSFEDLNIDGDNDPSTNPTNSDNDSYPDYLDIDSDNDGIPDNVEAQTTSGYIAPSLEDLNDNGLDDAYESGTNLGLIPVNTDESDLPDYLDLDSDNDNIPDNIEGNDYDFDGFPDVVLIGSDKDNDGLDDNFEGTEQIDIDVNDEINDPINDLPNTDGDGESNYRDVDDDGDGINSINEDINEDGDYANDDTDFDGTPDYLDPDSQPVFEDVEVFNVVTPNGDGAHDFLMITGLDVRPNNNIAIYNRWGILVYSTESYNSNTSNTWDGTSQARVTYNQGEKLPVGTYFYILKYEDLDGTNKTLSGHIYLN